MGKQAMLCWEIFLLLHSNLQKAQYAVGGSWMEVNDGQLPLLGVEVANQQSVAFRSFLEVKHILK